MDGKQPLVSPEEDEDIFGVDADKVPENVRLHPILTNEEVEAARKKALEKIQAERRKAALRQVEEEETERLRRVEGMTSGVTVEDEIVSILIDVPDWVPWVAVNGAPYWAGFVYPVPRHVARTINEQMQNAWRTHDLADGKSTTQQFQRKRHTTVDGVTQAVHNAPERLRA